MRRVLVAGDHFIRSEIVVDQFRARFDDLDFTSITLPWPHEPFGDVSTVTEASGTVDDMIAALHDRDVLLTQMAPVTAEVLAHAPALRYIGVCRGGPVNVDLDAATAAGVMVGFAPARNSVAAAEFTVGLMLAAMRRIGDASAALHAGQWRGDYYAYEKVGIELHGSTVGLVGYGAIAKIVARILRAFGAIVIASDPYADAAAARDDGVALTDLTDLLRRSDVVSLHSRYTPDTHHLLNAENLPLLRSGAVLVNTARGGLLDYTAVERLLTDGHLAAIGLDVYDVEPPPTQWRLRSLPNVVCTPHLAGATRQTVDRAVTTLADDFARLRSGSPLRNLANPAVLDSHAWQARTA